jgi:hypothetical protein
MPSSGMLRSVAIVRTDVLEERSVSIIRDTRMCELRTALVVTSYRRTLRRNNSSQRVSQLLVARSEEIKCSALCFAVTSSNFIIIFHISDIRNF